MSFGAKLVSLTTPGDSCGPRSSMAPRGSGRRTGDFDCLLFETTPAMLVGAIAAANHRRSSMGDKSPKAKDRDKKQKTSAKDQAKAQKAAAAAAKTKK